MGKTAKVHPLEESSQGKPEAKRSRALTPWDDMERMFEEMFTRPWFRSFPMEWPRRHLEWKFEGRVPAVDIIDREDELLVKAELPGVKKDELNITLTDDSVTLAGETRHETKDEKENYYRSEIVAGSFSRTVALPCTVDTDNAKAEFKDGVLTLRLPKTEKTRKRTIKID